MASTRSDPGGAGALERRASGLLALMAAGAVTCVLVGLGLRWLGAANAAERWLSAATTVIVVAPLVSLVGVGLSASRGRGRVAIFAWGALLVTLLGMGLAR